MQRVPCILVATLSLVIGVALGFGFAQKGSASPQVDEIKKELVRKQPDEVRFVVDPRVTDLVLSHADMTFSGNAGRFIIEIHRPLPTVNSSIGRLFKENKSKPFAGRVVTDFAPEFATVTTIHAYPSQFIVEWSGSDRIGNDAAASAVVDAKTGKIKRIDFMGADWRD
jgi:hypothetical protein